MKKYLVIRKIMFYCVGNEVTLAELGQFFTKRAVEDFITYGFIKEI